MTEEKRKVVIDRSQWRCGGLGDRRRFDEGNYPPECVNGLGVSQLYNSAGYMCCLGFASQQLGELPTSKLKLMRVPSDLEVLIPPLTEEQDGVLVDSDLSECAMTLNDDRDLSRSDRERKLTKLFDEYGIDLEFTGEYVG